jgi:hypothetical protein
MQLGWYHAKVGTMTGVDKTWRHLAVAASEGLHQTTRRPCIAATARTRLKRKGVEARS